ncbi:MAG: OmpA family protein, partial [Bacteroidetes bacterium]
MGFTDQTGPETYNAGLSYQRARAVIEHLTNQHG